MRKILFILLLLPYILFADDNSINGSCPGEVVEELNNVSVDTIHSENGSVNGNGNDIYNFKVDTNGIVEITATTRNDRKFKFMVSNSSCGNWNIYNSSSALKTHPKQTIYLNQGDTIYFRIKSVGTVSGGRKYRIDINFTKSDFICANPRDFNLSYQINIKGDIELIGNTIMCKNDNGHCGNPGDATNNSINMMYIDGDNNNSTFNSSSARLNLPPNSEILWAKLYWQGYLVDGTDTQKANSAYIKYAYSLSKSGNNLEYTTMKAENHNWVYFNASRWYYQGSVDITNFVKEKGNGWYWVADIVTQTGKPPGGSYGAWSIAVVYKNSSKHLKNLTIYDGYIGVSTGNDDTTAHDYANAHNCPKVGVQNVVSIDLSGFITPSKGVVDSKFFVFAGEGDKGISKDHLQMKNKSGTDKYLKGNINPYKNIFNSTISKNDTHLGSDDLYPHYSTNSCGIDIDTFDVNHIYNDYIIENNQSSTTITLDTVGDGYFPGVFGFSTDLYEPRVCYVQTLVPVEEGPLYIGKPIFVNIDIKNQPKDENDTNIEPASGVEVKTFIDNEYLEYNQSSFYINDIDDSNFTHLTDINSDDRYEFDSDQNLSIYRVGRGANENNGGRLEPFDALQAKFTALVKKSGDFNVSNRYLIKYRNEQIGKVFNDIPIEECKDFNTSLKVNKYGKFRIIEGKYENIGDWTTAWNSDNLETKVSPLGNNKYCVLAGDSEEDNANPITEEIRVDIQLLDFSNSTNGVVIKNGASDYIEENLTIPAGAKKCFTLPLNIVDRAIKKAGFKIYQTDNHSNRAKSDYFAIRPDKFLIETASNLFSGEKFLITFKALNKNSLPLVDYNESALDINKSFTYNKAVKTGCIQGNLNLNSPIIFKNGIAEVNATYDEVGDLNITIKEIINREFALIDKNDTTNGDRLIKSFTKVISNKPYKLKVENLNYNGGFGSNPNWWLYSGAFPAHYITITSKIRAFNRDNNITKNFDKDCASKDVNISYNISSTNSNVDMNYYTNFDGDFNGTINDINRTQTIPSTLFENGEGSISFNYNAEKNISTPINPFKIRANELNITSTTLSKEVSGATINNSTIIYYGRVVAKTLKTKNAVESPLIEVEIYSNSNSPFLNGFTQTYLNWYKNPLHDNNSNGTILNVKNEQESGGVDSAVTFTNNGVKEDGELELFINNTTPNQSKNLIIHLNIDSWLWTSQFNNSYSYPNGGCLKHPCFRYIYQASHKETGVISGTYQGSDINSSFENSFDKKGVKTFR